ERLRGGGAVHAHDAAVGRFHDCPPGAGDRIGIDPAQVATRGGIAVVLHQIGELARIARPAGGRALVVQHDRALVLVADVQQIGFAVAAQRGVPGLDGEAESGGEDRGGDQHADIREAACSYQAAYSVPSTALPGAPLRTSNTPAISAPGTGTITQLPSLWVTGSSGTLRRYCSVASACRESGYLPLSAWYLPIASRIWNRFSFSTASRERSMLVK